MITSKNLLFFSLLTIGFKTTLLFVPQNLGLIVWNTLNVTSFILYFLNFLFLYKYVNKQNSYSLKKFPIVFIGLSTFLCCVDLFIPYQHLKESIELTDIQSGLLILIPFFLKTSISIIGETSYATSLIKTNKKMKKLGIGIIVANILTILNFYVPLLIGGLFLNYSNNHLGYLTFAIGLLPIIFIGLFYAYQIKLSITPK